MHRWSQVLAVLLLALWVGAARAADAPEDRLKHGHCGCDAGQGCYHYLRAPFRAPEDPCRCGMCLAGGSCGGQRRPEGWPAGCMDLADEACFWKRHAASWGLRCSRCATDATCTACDGLPKAPDAAAKAQLEKQLAIEFPDEAARKKACVGWSKHFYVVSDIPQLKVLSQSGGPRVVDAHEIVHLYLQRAEQARADFVAAFGDELRQDKPMAIYLARTTKTKDAWRARYFGGGKTEMVYAGAEGKIAGGFCWNGFAASFDQYGEDRDLHAYCRHMIGHILFSCWHGVGGFNQECPRWAFVAAADWLCKLHPFFEDWVVFCHQEGAGPSGTGKDWDVKARAIAAGRRIPVETLFSIPSMSRLSYDDHVRSWSYMDTMLREDRARWLAVLRRLREGKEHAFAFRDGLGLTPEDFDARWADRMLGKRKTMAEGARDAAAAEAAGGVDVAERRRIQREQDPATLAALIRGLDRVRDVETAKLVLDKLALDSDAVREAGVVLLQRTQAPEVVAWLRASGLADRDGVTRALVARVLGTLKDAAARPALEGLLDDAHWLVRANAATALASIADPASGPALLARLDDRSPKAWIAKADALAGFGRVGTPATPAVCDRLKAKEWQVRLTACRALVAFGDARAVEPLIERLESESGRLQREILRALRTVSGENFGLQASTWRNWWKGQQPLGLPPRAKEAPPANPEDERYAKPTKRPGDPLDEEPVYYGRRIYSEAVVFVLDLSLSMGTTIEVPKEAQEKLGTIAAGPRIDVAKAAAHAAIGKLDPRARFNLVFFSSEVRPWKDGLVPAATHQQAGANAVNAAGIDGETNIFGALKAGFGLHDTPTLEGDLDRIPDTVFFLTDGTPTRGEITDVETILSWVRDLNRFAKVELNVIAMGSLGLDLPFLRRLAAENTGFFVHVPDRK